MGVHANRLSETPLAILDFETTGLSPRNGARVVEVSVVRVDPGQPPRLVLDTLINPEGPVHCSNIHGIYDDDVVGAPRFCDIAGDLGRACEGAVIGAYNASFDMQFLMAEQARLPRLRDPVIPPYICLMFLRPLLGLGKRTSLETAAMEIGLPSGTHRAAEDCLVQVGLWQYYLESAATQQLHTFRDLIRGRPYKFTESFEEAPIDAAAITRLDHRSDSIAMKPRLDDVRDMLAERRPVTPTKAMRRRSYWNALRDAWFNDGQLSAGEIVELRRRQELLGIDIADLRTLHARFFGEVLSAVTEDDEVDEIEAGVLRDLDASFAQLGWAPGH